MKKQLIYSLALLLLFYTGAVKGQTIFVDPVKGREQASGTLTDPLNTLEKATTLAATFSGNEAVTIKLAPGFYLLTKQLLFNPFNKGADTVKYTIEAQVMPDDTAWRPSKMPVIQSISFNNKNYGQFDHCMAIEVERNNVCIRGLKFLGNPNTSVGFFYIIERHKPDLKGLEISQCYFIGDKNSAPVQGAVFAQGENIDIGHCVFYGCKNAVMVFNGLKNFALTHSIIYGAYEGAFWYGYNEPDQPFTFVENVIAGCNYFFIGGPKTHSNYVFKNSLITDNTHYMGFNKEPLEPDMENKATEINIVKTGYVLLNQVTADGVPKDYLNVATNSAGNQIKAGIFKK